LGGTFDPIHNGHIVLARNAYEQFSLDEVWMLVSPDPPHKREHSVTGFQHRYNMVRLAAEKETFMLPSDYEVRLTQPSYTAQTLRELRKDYPGYRFFFIIGEDSLDAIETWYHPEEVMALTELIVAVRSAGAHSRSIGAQTAYLKERYGARISIIDSDYVNISSTDLRNRVAAGESIAGLVPPKVEEYIWTEKLYTASENS